MSYSYKIGVRKIEKGQAFVEIGGGSQLAQVIRQTVRYRQHGYDVLPLNSGTSDAYGVYTQFVPDAFAHVADMSRWERPTAERNYWRKIYNRKQESSGNDQGQDAG